MERKVGRDKKGVTSEGREDRELERCKKRRKGRIWKESDWKRLEWRKEGKQAREREEDRA